MALCEVWSQTWAVPLPVRVMKSPHLQWQLHSQSQEDDALAPGMACLSPFLGPWPGWTDSDPWFWPRSLNMHWALAVSIFVKVEWSLFSYWPTDFGETPKAPGPGHWSQICSGQHRPPQVPCWIVFIQADKKYVQLLGLADTHPRPRTASPAGSVNHLSQTPQVLKSSGI